MALHTVLGASGAVGRAVIGELQQRKLPLRAVERHGGLEGVDTILADLLNKDQARRAVAGSSHVYLCVGLPYRAAVWQRDWPQLMDNVLQACRETGARLIFLDNVYMYGPTPLQVPFEETHPQEPPTAKGRARKETADLLLQASARGEVQALIGRSADFYGPGAVNSPFYISMLQRMLAGKAPQSIYPPDVPHTYAFTPDIGRALVTLALEEDCYGQVWHLPAGEPIPVSQISALLNKALGTSYKTTYLSGFMVRLLGLFIPGLKEVAAMLYQFREPYVMSFEKFRGRFPDFRLTGYEEGVGSMVDSFRRGG